MQLHKNWNGVAESGDNESRMRLGKKIPWTGEGGKQIPEGWEFVRGARMETGRILMI